MISEEEFVAWLQDPVTIAVKKLFADRRADRRNEWEMCEPSQFLQETFVLGNVANIGECRGLAFMETMSYETYLTELDNEERVGAKAPGSGSAS